MGRREYEILTESLEELERTDPAVRKAADDYDRVRDQMFFEHGRVEVKIVDAKSRQAALEICVPWCVLHAATPAMLGAGTIDEYRIHDPVAAWMPAIGSSRISGEIMRKTPGFDCKLNKAIQGTLESLLRLFHSMGEALVNLSDAVPMLPLGVYVVLRYRCCVDDLAKVLLELEPVATPGVPEFRYALAAALAASLKEMSG